MTVIPVQTIPNQDQTVSRGVSLGNITKLQSTTDRVERRNWRNDAVKRRYRMLDTVRGLLRSHRVAKCLHRPFTKKSAVHVLLDAETGRAHIKGPLKCGAVWVCPVCSARIAIERRNELSVGISKARAKGWQVAFVTYTARHTRDDDLVTLLGGMRKAQKSLKSGRWWQENVKAYGFEGDIKSTETTYSHANGWHVHFHSIMLFSEPVDLDELETRLHRRWLHVLERNDLDCDREHGVMVAPGEMASQYIAKWGLQSELTGGTVKRGREGHYTPFELVMLYQQGHKWGAKLFQTFAAAFKGVNQLRWSRGLRDKLEMTSSMTDQEIVDADVSERSTVVARMTWGQYKLLLSRGGPGIIGRLLVVAESGPGAVGWWLRRYGVYLDGQPDEIPKTPASDGWKELDKRWSKAFESLKGLQVKLEQRMMK